MITDVKVFKHLAPIKFSGPVNLVLTSVIKTFTAGKQFVTFVNKRLT
jgi:hypothetical protein